MTQPHKLGVQGTKEQFSDFSHFWRLIGHLLGIQDRFNVCGETLEETFKRAEAIRLEIIKPALEFPNQRFITYHETAIEGMWYFEPFLHYQTHMYMTNRLAGVPGFHYFQSEAPEVNNRENISRLPLYARARLFWMVICHQYLLQFTIIRIFSVILRIVFCTIYDRIPVIAIFKFGRKNARVRVLRQYQ